MLAECFTPLPYLIPTTTLGNMLSFHFMEKEAEALRGKETCLNYTANKGWNWVSNPGKVAGAWDPVLDFALSGCVTQEGQFRKLL